MSPSKTRVVARFSMHYYLHDTASVWFLLTLFRHTCVCCTHYCLYMKSLPCLMLSSGKPLFEVGFLIIRPSSGAMLLPFPNLIAIRFDCSTAEARLRFRHCGRVVQIHGFVKPQNNSTCRNAIPPKYRSLMFELLPCQSRVAWQSLSNLTECQT